MRSRPSQVSKLAIGSIATVLGRLVLSHHGPDELHRCIGRTLPICRRCTVMLGTAGIYTFAMAASSLIRRCPAPLAAGVALATAVEGWLDLRDAVVHRPWRQSIATAAATIALLHLREEIGIAVTAALVGVVPLAIIAAWSGAARRAQTGAPLARTIV